MLDGFDPKENQKSLMEIASAQRPMDGQQVYNIVDSAFNRKLAPRMKAVEDKLDALIKQVMILAEAEKKATKSTSKDK